MPKLEDVFIEHFEGVMTKWKADVTGEAEAVGFAVRKADEKGGPLIAVIPPYQTDREVADGSGDKAAQDAIGVAHCRLIAKAPMLAWQLSRMIDAARTGGPDAHATLERVKSIGNEAAATVLECLTVKPTPEVAAELLGAKPNTDRDRKDGPTQKPGTDGVGGTGDEPGRPA